MPRLCICKNLHSRRDRNWSFNFVHSVGDLRLPSVKMDFDKSPDSAHCAGYPERENFLAPRLWALCENHSKLCLTKRKNYKQINLHKSQQQQQQPTIVAGLAAESFMKQSGEAAPPTTSACSGPLGVDPRTQDPARSQYPEPVLSPNQKQLTRQQRLPNGVGTVLVSWGGTRWA